MEINVYPLNESFGGDLMKFCIKEARVDLPDWYKNSESYVKDSGTPLQRDKNMTMKKCTPILDYLSIGLNLYTPYAIYAEGRYPNRKVESATHEPYFKLSGHHLDQKQGLPVSEDFDQTPFKIEFPYSIETPKGYSSLFLGHSSDSESPLFFPSAIVQTDKYRAPVNFPFFMKKDFQGKIEAGTLFMKVLFIKRDPISLNYKEYSDDNGRISQHRRMVEAFGSGFYKKLRLDKI